MIQKLIKKRNQKGFTLVELLIVIAIIGILAAIAIPQFAQYRNRAHMAATRSDAKNAYTAVQAWISDNVGVVIPGDTSTSGYSLYDFYLCQNKPGSYRNDCRRYRRRDCCESSDNRFVYSSRNRCHNGYLSSIVSSNLITPTYSRGCSEKQPSFSH